ncbi:hypothetical protein BC835DRAFT_635456 [Cytidiella melzeri]|nr:hypothetical protein BC835DRAFT_635456 [Cytidiella melzeri]
MSTVRPRRTNKTSARGSSVTSSTSQVEPIGRNPAKRLEYLLTHGRSKLTTMDISDILSYQNFLKLSELSQQSLCALLPPSAFAAFLPSLDSSHPAARRQPEPQSDIRVGAVCSPATLDSKIFSNPFLLSGAKAFQDHMFSGWRSSGAKDTVTQYEQGIANGALHAEWKDEQWAREHPSFTRAKPHSVDLDLVALAKRSVLQQGDVVFYRRRFSSIGVTVEKELLVCSIDPSSHAINFLLQPGKSPSLPRELLVANPPHPQPPTLAMDCIMSSVELEEGVLDLNKQIPHEVFSIANDISGHNTWTNVGNGSADAVGASRAAKALSVWRWTDETKSDVELHRTLDKGGRELLGTVHYLNHAR